MRTCPNCSVDFYGGRAHECASLRLREVWRILEEECGASRDPQSGHGFIAFAYYFGDTSIHGPKEFRFMGNLGFGGKVWLQGHRRPPIDVTGGETPEAAEMVRRANERLAALFR